MAKNIDFMGAIFPDVPSVRLPQQGGGLVSFDDTTDANATAADIAQGKTAYVNGEKLTGTASGGTAVINPLSVTANGTYTAPVGVDGYSPVTVNVSGGGGIGTLLTTVDLGHITQTSGTATNTGKVVSVTGGANYDILICSIVGETQTIESGSRLLSTTSIGALHSSNSSRDIDNVKPNTASSNASNNRLNIKVNSTEKYSSNFSQYGVYANAFTISGANVTLEIYARYSSTNSGTIDDNYTAFVYGIDLYDLL